VKRHRAVRVREYTADGRDSSANQPRAWLRRMLAWVGHIGSRGHGSLRPTVPIAAPSSTVASVIGSRMDPLIMARR